MPVVYNWLHIGHDFLLPTPCALCGARGAAGLALCSGCLGDLPRNDGACRICGRPLPAGAVACGRCQRQPPPFAASLAPYRYGPPLDRLIQDLKFAGRLPLAGLFGTLLARAAVARGALPEQLVPVPLHAGRLRERGYNQAAEIARRAGRLLQIPVADRCCRRTRATAPQSLLPASARRANLRGAFALDRPLAARRVAIVDDVMTSGHTVAELARLLKRAGAREVVVWVVARAG